MPPSNSDLLDIPEAEAYVSADIGGDEVPLDLETLRVLAANESIRELILPILDDMLSSVAFEIADMEFFLSTGPLGSLEAEIADDTGLTAEIEAEWESL